MPLPAVLAGALLFGARVALFSAPRIATVFAAKAVVKVAGGALVRVGARVGIKMIGKIAVSVLKSPFKIGLKAFASLKAVGALTAGLLAAQFAGGLLTNIWSAVVNTTHFALNFNLNASDAELDAQLLNRLNSFYGLLGGAVGSATGYLVCGAIPGALSFAFNPGVAAAIMKDLDDEARSEVMSHVSLIARSAFQTLINAELTNKFKSARRFLKRNPDSKIGKFMRGLLGEENFKKWGESNRPSFTISKNVIEKKVDALPKGQKEFVEEFLEEFGDTCMESGFIIANNFDSQLAAYALMQRNILGRQVDVRVRFNARDKDDDDDRVRRSASNRS